MPARVSPTILRARLRALAESLSGPRTMKLRDARRTFEREYVRYTIERLGDRLSAARALGIGLSTLKEKIRKR
jgi:DNA-binding NtrC family response regulator